MIGHKYKFKIKGDGNIVKSRFEHAVSELKVGYCDAIFGPGGGILILDENDCLVFDSNKEPIYFSADNYLRKWSLLELKQKGE